MSTDELALVRYRDEILSVVEKPPRDSRAVAEAREKLLGGAHLTDFLDGVTKVIRIAYNGVAGDTELQSAIREIGFEIAELYDDSHRTIRMLRMTADSILTNFIGGYRFFLDGMEEMGITAIESNTDSAKQMAASARQLYARFEEEERKIEKLCDDTFRAQIDEVKQHAISALQHLVRIMLSAALFWKSMECYCEEQSSGKLEMIMEKAMRYENPEKRRKVFQSPVMKKQAMERYASWVAMEVVCDEYVKRTKGSREEFYKYLCENPTLEESQGLIHQLYREFAQKI